MKRYIKSGTEYTKPSKEQYEEYVAIRNSGVTNMWDIRFIENISRTGLDKSTCLYIMEHFGELADEYGVDISR